MDQTKKQETREPFFFFEMNALLNKFFCQLVFWRRWIHLDSPNAAIPGQGSSPSVHFLRNQLDGKGIKTQQTGGRLFNELEEILSQFAGAL